MLLFNDFFSSTLSYDSIFQNISCYCLTERKKPEELDKRRFQNISCYCLTFQDREFFVQFHIFQNISCYCLTNEKSLFLNRFFTKKNDFISFFNIFTNHPTNFSLSWETTYSSPSYYFFKKSLGKILNTSFISSFLTLPIMNPINQICNPNIQIHI